MIISVKGKVFTGLREGKRFTKLSWVRKRIKEELGFEPYPGTLNLSLPSDSQISIKLAKSKGWKIATEKGFCPGRFHRALIMGKVQGAIVRPEVQGYPEDIIEIVAPIYLRKEFHLEDGDEVEVKIWLE
jgi:CTP-dependent riboflavin kinase